MQNDSRRDPEAPGEKAGGALMYVRCAHCGEWMDVKPGHLAGISHGICPACFDEQWRRFLEAREERTDD